MHWDKLAIKYAAVKMFRISFIEKYRLFLNNTGGKSCKSTVKMTTVRHNIQNYTERTQTTSHSHQIVKPRNYLNILCSVWVIENINIQLCIFIFSFFLLHDITSQNTILFIFLSFKLELSLKFNSDYPYRERSGRQSWQALPKVSFILKLF